MPMSEHNIAASLRAICNNANAALFVLDARQHCIYLNPAGEAMTGYDLQELAGKPLHDIIRHNRSDSDPSPLQKTVMSGAFAAKEREQGEDIFIHRDGTFYPVAYTASPIMEEGQAVGTVIEARSLIEERENQSQQTRERALLASTFENAAVGMAHVGLDGSFIRINQQLCAIVGYEREELLKMTFQDITHPDDLNGDLALFQQIESGESEGYGLEKRYYRKNGALIWVRLTVSSQKDVSGEVLFCISIIEDITAIKEYQQHLEVMAGELNHRIKNTLAIVQAIASMSLPEDTHGKTAFMERITTLSRSHDLLLADKWSGSSIRAVVEQAIYPFGGLESERITAAGPEHILSPRTALALSMAINELGTNAVKYGALSDGKGCIAIAWKFVSQEGVQSLEFSWSESGGPKVSPPKSRGFGTTLIERALASEMKGKPNIDFAPTGIKFSCAFTGD